MRERETLSSRFRVALLGFGTVGSAVARRLVETTAADGGALPKFQLTHVFDRRADNLDYFATARAWNPAGAGDNFLFNPAEPRGFRIKLRTSF